MSNAISHASVPIGARALSEIVARRCPFFISLFPDISEGISTAFPVFPTLSAKTSGVMEIFFRVASGKCTHLFCSVVGPTNVRGKEILSEKLAYLVWKDGWRIFN